MENVNQQSTLTTKQKSLHRFPEKLYLTCCKSIRIYRSQNPNGCTINCNQPNLT